MQLFSADFIQLVSFFDLQGIHPLKQPIPVKTSSNLLHNHVSLSLNSDFLLSCHVQCNHLAVGLIFELLLVLCSTSVCWALICLLLYGASIVVQFILSRSSCSVSGKPNNAACLSDTTGNLHVFFLFLYLIFA